MIGTREEQNYVILYKMAKLGFSPSEVEKMEVDTVQAFAYLNDIEKKIYWETWAKMFGKLFGGK